MFAVFPGHPLEASPGEASAFNLDTAIWNLWIILHIEHERGQHGDRQSAPRAFVADAHRNSFVSSHHSVGPARGFARKFMFAIGFAFGQAEALGRPRRPSGDTPRKR